VVITCPQCDSRYRIDVSGRTKAVAKVKCPGCGHLFEISLAPAEETAASTSPGPAPRPKVLVVDDARFFREMIKDILHELPIDIIEAADGNEALAQILNQRPQLLLLDLNIPGMNGMDLIRELRSRPECRSLHILAMSGVQRGEETAAEVCRQGADDFLNKSFRPNDLQKRIRSQLGL